MKQFNEPFYTDAFDQEMLDWLIGKGYAVWDNHGNTPSLDELYLRCASATAFWTTSNTPTFDFGEYLTKNQFKEKIGMTNESHPENNTFTKSMLKSGEHVVKLADDSYHIVLGNRIVRDKDYIQLKSVSETLECSFDADLDIVTVYKVDKDFILDELPSGKSLTLLWQRGSPEQKEKRLQKEKLELMLQELQKECKLVEDEIMRLGD